MLTGQGEADELGKEIDLILNEDAENPVP
jgi:hypothetical protein